MVEGLVRWGSGGLDVLDGFAEHFFLLIKVVFIFQIHVITVVVVGL